jgi:hypothetical protein
MLIPFSAYFPYFEKIKVDFCDNHAVCVSPLSTFEWLKLGM